MEDNKSISESMTGAHPAPDAMGGEPEQSRLMSWRAGQPPPMMNVNPPVDMFEHPDDEVRMIDINQYGKVAASVDTMRCDEGDEAAEGVEGPEQA